MRLRRRFGPFSIRIVSVGMTTALILALGLILAPGDTPMAQDDSVGSNDFDELDSIVIPLPGQAPAQAPAQNSAPSPSEPSSQPVSRQPATEPPTEEPPATGPNAPASSPDAEAATATEPSGMETVRIPDIRVEALSQGDETAPNVTPAPAPAPTNADRGANAPRGGADPASSGAPGSVLVPVRGVETDRADARIVGEAPEARFHMFVPTVPRAPRLQLHYQTAVDILPTASELSIFVNDVFVGAFRPDATLRSRSVILDVPRDALVAGRNVVDIRGRQRHRVACGPDSAFELWSGFDTRVSGLVASDSRDPTGEGGGETVSPAVFAAAVARTIAEQRPIAVALENPGDRDAIRAVLAAAEEIGVLMGGRVPDYVARDDPFADPGQDADFVRIRAFPADRNGVRFVRGGDGAVVLAIDYTDADAATAVKSAFPSVAAPQIMTPMTGRAVPFAAFDIPDMNIFERYRRQDIDFRLPEDWLVENDRSAEISLDYAFVRGLPDQSQLIVSVNGNTVRLLPLDRGGGDVVNDFPVRFPARLLSPGLNAVTIETRIPGRPSTSACPDITAADGPPMAGVFRTSTLTIPEGSPFRSIPNLAPLTSPPGASDRTPITVDIGSGAGDRLERILTVAGALSASLGESANLRIGGTGEWGDASEDGVRLRVMRPVDLTEADIEAFGLSLSDLLPRLAVGNAPLPSSFTEAPVDTEYADVGDEVSPLERLRRTGLLPRADMAADSRFGDPRNPADRDDFTRSYWDRSDDPASGTRVDSDRDAGVLERVMMHVSGLPNRAWRFAGSLGWVTSSDPAIIVNSLDRPAAGMILDRVRDSQRSILVVADGTDQLRRLSQALATGIPGGGPRGSLALVSEDGWWVNYRGGARTVEQTDEISFDNAISSAGTLASAYPVGFIILVLAALALAAVAASRILARLGASGTSS